MATDLNFYTQQTVGMVAENRLPHAIIVETENMANALSYVTSCARAILKTDHLENYPDFFTLSPVGKINIIKIEAIRELIDRVQKTPNAGEQKVFVIFEAHRLNKNAANAPGTVKHKVSLVKGDMLFKVHDRLVNVPVVLGQV